MVKISLFAFGLSILYTLLVGVYASPIHLEHQEGGLQPREDSKLEERGIPYWQFYYGVDGATHQAKFNKWSAAGYRLISISVYGTPPSVLYAAVWVQRSGPAWQAIHGVDGSAYQSWFDKYAALGYVSTQISVTGPGDSAIYMGVMEQISVSSWVQRCGMAGSDYSTNTGTAFANKQILKSVSEYGTPSNRLYCAVWHDNPIHNRWDYWYTESYGDYQNNFNSETTKPYWRPAYVAVSEDQQISSLFTDTYVGSWVARHGMTAAELQSEYLTQKNNGLYLIDLHGGGSGGNTRYTGIWAQQDIPQTRTWTVTGASATGFKYNPGAVHTVDSTMQTFMSSNGVRQAQIAIAKNGNLLMSRAYSWQEAARHTTQPTDTFLLASISKMFVEAAVQTLYDNNKLTPSTLVYPLLGYTNAPDPRLGNITVQMLLDHRGGLNDTLTGFDPCFQMRKIAIAQHGSTSVPATKQDVVDYMSRVTLDYNPGAAYSYSNYGYLLLSRVVEHVMGEDYYTYLSNAILTPGNYNVVKWATAESAHTYDDVIQESANLGLSALNPIFPYNVATTFGGDGMDKEASTGPASLAASAQTIATFIHTHAVWGNGGRAPHSNRSGSVDGTSTWAESRDDGIDYAITVNTRDWPPNQSPSWLDLIQTEIPGWLNTGPTI